MIETEALVEQREAEAIQASLLATGEHMPLSRPGFRWVHLWHWPIRAMHWAAAVSVVVLVITGLYIGRPYFLTGAGPSGYAIQYVRLTHFIFAAVLVTTAIIRAYWLLVGNRFERWQALFPVRRRDLKNLVKMVKYYLFIQPKKGPHYLGHNPLQQIFYTLAYAVAGLLVVTGFIMFGEANPGGLIATFTLWLAPLFGGFQMVRVFHHVATWFFPLFVIAHVYLALRSEYLEKQGNMSSIISGGRFVPENAHYVDG